MAKRKNRVPTPAKAPKNKWLRSLASKFEQSNRILIISLITIAVLFALQLTVFTSSYQTNDDIGMTFLASGKGTSPSPNEHLRYSHVIFGMLLKFLYGVTDAVPWYGLYHFVVHFFAMAALLYAVLSSEKSLKRYLFFILYFLSIEVFFLTNLQFTVTACIAAQSAVILYITALNEDRKRLWFLYLASMIFFIIGCMVRSSGSLLILLLGLPIISHLAWKNRKNRSRIIQMAIFWAVLIVTVTGLKSFERNYYNNDPAWSDFFEFNSMKSRIIDFDHISYTRENQHIFKEVGWSQNDFYTFRSWFYADEELFSTENVRKIVEQFPARKSNVSIAVIMSGFANVFSKGWLFIIVAAYFLLFVKGGRGHRRAILSTLVLIVVMMAWLIYAKRLPARVFQPMLSYFAVLCLYFGDMHLRHLSKSRKILHRVFLLFFAVAIFYGATLMYGESVSAREHSESFRATIDTLAPKKDQLFIVWGASLPYVDILPFDTMDFMENFNLISLGTTLRTPVTKARMKEFGIDNIYRAPYEKKNIYFIVRNNKYLFLYTQFVKEHYDVDIKFRYIFTSDDFNVAQVGIQDSNNTIEVK